MIAQYRTSGPVRGNAAPLGPRRQYPTLLRIGRFVTLTIPHSTAHIWRSDAASWYAPEG
jgi:hypothetical protein